MTCARERCGGRASSWPEQPRAGRRGGGTWDWAASGRAREGGKEQDAEWAMRSRLPVWEKVRRKKAGGGKEGREGAPGHQAGQAGKGRKKKGQPVPGLG